MTVPESHEKHLTCRIVEHHYIVVYDKNPENLTSSHLHCTHCGKIKEIVEYEPRVVRYEGIL